MCRDFENPYVAEPANTAWSQTIPLSEVVQLSIPEPAPQISEEEPFTDINADDLRRHSEELAQYYLPYLEVRARMAGHDDDYVRKLGEIPSRCIIRAFNESVKAPGKR